MHVVAPVHSFDKIDAVLKQLDMSGESAAPVVDGSGRCIGILTETDIERYQVMLERFAARDETVIDEMFEVDQFGQRRASNLNFDQVERHMTHDPVVIGTNQSIRDAIMLLEENPNINHLVVVDEDHHGVGIVNAEDAVLPARVASSDEVTTSTTDNQ